MITSTTLPICIVGLPVANREYEFVRRGEFERINEVLELKLNRSILGYVVIQGRIWRRRRCCKHIVLPQVSWFNYLRVCKLSRGLIVNVFYIGTASPCRLNSWKSSRAVFNKVANSDRDLDINSGGTGEWHRVLKSELVKRASNSDITLADFDCSRRCASFISEGVLAG